MAPKKVTLRMSPIRMVWGAWAAAALLLLGAVAAPGALQFDVFGGYDDIIPDRSWFPIACELNNDGPPFNAIIEVSTGSLNGSATRRIPVDLPSNTRKRVFIPVFSSSSSWQVRLLDEGGRVLGEQTVQRDYKPALRNFPIVAGLARNVGGLPAFPEIKAQPGAKLACARLQTSLFPDNPLALEGIDLLYLNSSKAIELTVPQVTALAAWLEHGGHLVVGIEQVTDISGTPWLRNLAPCLVTSMTEAPAGGALEAWLQGAPPPSLIPEPPKRKRNPFGASQAVRLTTNGNGGFTASGSMRSAARTNAVPPPAAPLAPDALFGAANMEIAALAPRNGRVLVGDASLPLAVEGPRGRGLVTFLAFSPEREPFLSWQNRPQFWARLAGIPASLFEQTDRNGYAGGRMSSDAIFGAMIDSKQVHKLPLGWLLVLLAVYLIVIGPLDQYWLKKINRQMLTWVTFPCYVLIFSALIYWIGFHLRAGELEWNELNVVDILSGEDHAVLRGQTYISIYSPVNARYRLASSQPFATLRGEYLGNFGNQENSRAEVIQRGDSFEAEAFIPVWTSQLFVSDWLQGGEPPITMSLKRQDTNWLVHLESGLDHAIGPLRVAMEGRIYDIPELAANQRKTFSFDPSQGRPVEDFVQEFTGAFRGAVQARSSSFGRNSAGIEDIAAGAMAVSFVSAMNQSGNEWEDFGAPPALDLTRFARSGYGVLLAWDADHSVTDPLNQFPARRTHRHSLLRLVTPLAQPNT